MLKTLTPEAEAFLDAQVLTRRMQFARNVAKYVLAPAAILVVLLLIVGVLFIRQLLVLAGAMVPITLSSWLYPRLELRGQAGIGAYALLISILVALFINPFILPQVLPGSCFGYVLVAILGVVVLGEKDSRWLSGACTFAFLVSLVLITWQSPNWFSLPNNTIGVVIGISVVNTSTLLATIVIIYRILVDQEDLFRQSKRANLEIENRAASEQKLREHLQAVAQEYVEHMTQVGQGNLATRLTINGQDAKDPLIMLGHSLNQMVANLQGMILKIRDASNNLSSATTEILAATTQQASGANEQSAAITQTTTTVDQVKVIAEQLVERGQEVVDISQRTVKVSLAGKNTVQETIGGMNRIRERVESIAKNIIALSEQTLRIREIIATVDDIAAQSNMLALNASVEAAHAGEHGKGFAAVAVEVRNLARQSQQATTQVRAILSQVQKGISDAATTTEGSTKVVEEGMQLAVQTQETIGQLAAVIDESAQMAMQMVAGGRQQASGVEQIAVAMQNINQATAQNLSSTRQTEDAAQNLNSLARSLTETVEQYQL